MSFCCQNLCKRRFVVVEAVVVVVAIGVAIGVIVVVIVSVKLVSHDWGGDEIL